MSNRMAYAVAGFSLGLWAVVGYIFYAAYKGTKAW